MLKAGPTYLVVLTLSFCSVALPCLLCSVVVAHSDLEDRPLAIALADAVSLTDIRLVTCLLNTLQLLLLARLTVSLTGASIESALRCSSM